MLVVKRNNGEGIEIVCPDGNVVSVFITVHRNNTSSIGIEAAKEYKINRIVGRKVKTGQNKKQRSKGHANGHARAEALTQKQEAANTQDQRGDERLSAPAGQGGYGLFASGVCSVLGDGCAAGITGEDRGIAAASGADVSALAPQR